MRPRRPSRRGSPGSSPSRARRWPREALVGHQLGDDAVLGRPEKRGLHAQQPEDRQRQRPALGRAKSTATPNSISASSKTLVPTMIVRLLRRSASTPAGIEMSIRGIIMTIWANAVCSWPPAVVTAAAIARKITICFQALSLNAPRNWVTNRPDIGCFSAPAAPPRNRVAMPRPSGAPLRSRPRSVASLSILVDTHVNPPSRHDAADHGLRYGTDESSPHYHVRIGASRATTGGKCTAVPAGSYSVGSDAGYHGEGLRMAARGEGSGASEDGLVLFTGPSTKCLRCDGSRADAGRRDCERRGENEDHEQRHGLCEGRGARGEGRGVGFVRFVRGLWFLVRGEEKGFRRVVGFVRLREGRGARDEGQGVGFVRFVRGPWSLVR